MDYADPSNPMNDYHTMVIDAGSHSFNQNYEYEEKVHLIRRTNCISMI